MAAGLIVLGSETIHSGAALLVVDGDTVHSGEERIRLLGLDAPEIHHAQCEAERRLAVLAKRRLEQLLQSGTAEFQPDHGAGRDKYGRLLAHLLVNGEDVACILINEGYARAWTGHREDWCHKLDLAKQADAKADCGTTSSTD